MLKSLIAATTVVLAGAAFAEESWETIPPPPAMPEAETSGM